MIGKGTGCALGGYDVYRELNRSGAPHPGLAGSGCTDNSTRPNRTASRRGLHSRRTSLPAGPTPLEDRHPIPTHAPRDDKIIGNWKCDSGRHPRTRLVALIHKGREDIRPSRPRNGDKILSLRITCRALTLCRLHCLAAAAHIDLFRYFFPERVVRCLTTAYFVVRSSHAPFTPFACHASSPGAFADDLG